MFKNYYEIRVWLESFIPFTYSKQNLGLERIEYLLKLLGNPQKKFKSILVGGTSGKGSTAYYIAKLLEFSENSENSENQKTQNTQKTQRIRKSDKSVNQRIRISDTPARRPSDLLIHRNTESSEYSGLKIGLHLSPHLVDMRERMQILESQKLKVKSEKSEKTEEISVGDLIKLINQIRPVVEKIKRANPDLIPSYFEILVAASFLYFAREKVDWAVVEVGLGGRLDATNILQPEAVVITNVGLDHTEILGKTIEKIAYEKAGIIKTISNIKYQISNRKRKNKEIKSVLVVTGARGKGLKVIEKVAKAKKARLITVNPQLKITGLKSDIKDHLIIYKDIERDILNSVASCNFLLSLIAVLTLGLKPTKEAIWKVSNLAFPGRFELIDSNVILDGAHNADKIKYLIKMIKSYTNYSNNQSEIVLVIGFKKGKSWKKMVGLLMKNIPVKKVIATQFYAVTDTGPPRLASGEADRFSAVEPEEIGQYVESKWKVKVESSENSQQAVFEALNANSLDANQLILVTGSLYLVGEARTLWKLPAI